MTRTDRAFIQAFDQSLASQAAETVATTTVDTAPAAPAPPERATPSPGAVGLSPHIRFAHGPHARPSHGGGKTPLSEALERRRQAAAGDSAGLAAGTHVRRFLWPAVVETLAAQHRDAYLNLAPDVDAEPFVLGVAGLHRGAGSTTTSLAAARCLAGVMGSVGLVDTETGIAGGESSEHLGEALGLLHTQTLAQAAAAGQPAAAAMIHAERDQTSVAIAGDFAALPRPAAEVTLGQLASSRPLTIVDFGPVLDRKQAWRGGSLASLAAAIKPTGVVLVRAAGDLSGAVSAAQRIVESAGAPVLGLLENRVAAAQL